MLHSSFTTMLEVQSATDGDKGRFAPMEKTTSFIHPFWLEQYQTKCMHVICLVYICYIHIFVLCGFCILTLSHTSTSHYGRYLVIEWMCKLPHGKISRGRTAPEHKFQGESADLQCLVEHPMGYKHPKRIIEVPGFGKQKT